jgi:O-antigen/teichoic acid export membrane protein
VSKSAESSLKKRFAKVVASGMIQMLSFQGTTFLVNLFMARFLGPTQFGLFSAGVQTLNSAGQSAQLATGSVASRYVGQTYGHERNHAVAIWAYCRRVGLTSALVVSLALLVFAPWVADVAFHQPSLVNAIRWSGVGTFFLVACQQTLQVLAAVEAVRFVAKVSVFAGTIYTICAIFGGVQAGAEGGVIGIVVAYIVLWIPLVREDRREFGASTTDSPEIRAEIAIVKKQLVPASVAGIVLLGQTWVLLAIVTNNAGAAQAGMFSAANQIRLLLMTGPQILNSAGLVMINRVAKSKGSGTADRMAVISLVGASIVCSLIGLVMAPTLTVIFGHKYGLSVGIFAAFLPAVVLESSLLAVRQRLQLHGRYWEWLFGIAIPWQVGTTIIALLLVPKMGATGGAIAYSGGMIVGLLGAGIVALMSKKSATP